MTRMMILLTLLVMTTPQAHTQTPDPVPHETEVAKVLAKRMGGEAEVRLWDGTRVDIMTKTHAIEVDWSSKWAEAIGQALYYSDVTETQPGVILLVKDKEKEARFIYRFQTVAVKRGIKFWIHEVGKD